MGEQHVSEQANEEQLQAFMRALLDDVEALERLLQEDRIESGVRRIGAEQEMFLVDRALRPAPLALEVLERAADDRLTTELARFNLEANLSPLPFGGDCLRRLEAELSDVVGRAAEAARAVGADVLLAGILPTLRAGDLRLESLTPAPRYHELNRALRELRQGDFRVSIHGLDELEMTHDNILLESCNTSFQVHLQVGAREFAPLYNLAQAVTAPVLAAAVNSPLLLGQRLWQETRIALFESSVDTRPSAREGRQHKPRVHFGDGWVQEGALELFREDIARFRVIMTAETGEPPLSVLARGEVPDLKALRVHNGTVYRWNRPCYGVAGGVAHLRIESRALPAGPTVLDEVANAAFFFGLMSGLAEAHPRIDLEMPFEDAKANFFAAARHGLKAQLTWTGGRSFPAPELILSHLLPAARGGLAAAGIDAADIDRYLGVVEERVRRGQTGAQWALGSLASMAGQGTSELQCRALAAAMLAHQQEEARSGGAGRPVHTWEPAALEADRDLLRDSYRTVGQFMSTDLFTVRPTDIVDFAASVMDWRHVRHVPVEDDQGRLVGVVSHRALLRLVARGAPAAPNGSAPPTVASIMRTDPVTITPETPTLEAMRIMREQRVGCLPVVAGERLVGIVTERDLIDVSATLLEAFLREA
ncbi:CBS domain-containing protein [Sorangium sp. So ce260]|uniref:CBS domain-containing protein n=1 Tax=Sorangium sp. So ce260 TaxID=3133291 RepID=UPI003F647418